MYSCLLYSKALKLVISLVVLLQFSPLALELSSFFKFLDVISSNIFLLCCAQVKFAHIEKKYSEPYLFDFRELVFPFFYLKNGYDLYFH